jgi:hypothetical protein
MINAALQEKIRNIQSNMDVNVEEKSKLLNEKRAELLGQIEILKTKYEEIDKITQQNEELESSIMAKRDDMIQLVRKNLDIFNKNEKVEIIDSNESTLDNGNYACRLSNNYNYVSAIEIVNYSLPDVIYNINPHNNILYYITAEDNNIDCDKDMFFQKRENVKLLGIPAGNYTIDFLLETLNKVLNQDNIEIKLNPGNNFITIKKINDDNPLTLFTDYNHYQNNILELLGFENQQQCNNCFLFTSNKSYDLRADKTIQIYITNISTTQPICKIMLGSNRIYQVIQKMTNPIKDISIVNIEIKDSKNRNIYLGDKNFVIELSIKSIGEITEIETEKEEDEESLYDKIINLIN